MSTAHLENWNEQPTAETGERTASRIVRSVRTTEGGGFIIRRPFPTSELGDVDPFLLLDEMGPVQYGPGQALGAPAHPHRGFETVTYVLDGAMEHRDSAGNFGRLGPGDVQWMTAGKGVVHSELPAKDFLDRGGKMHGFQLWVNLPSRDKLIAPRYQDIPASHIPKARSEDGKIQVAVIAGEALGARAVIDTRTPIFYLHFLLEPGAKLTQSAEAAFNTFAFVVDGSGTFGQNRRAASSGDLVIFDHDGDAISIASANESKLSVLLIGGTPLGEPVARHGPFVMNTPDEIYQAFDDFRSGRMGRISS